MGGRTVEIKFDIFTMKKSWVEERWKTNSIGKEEKKMGGRMVEIKFDIFTMKKSFVMERWKRKFYIYIL